MTKIGVLLLSLVVLAACGSEEPVDPGSNGQRYRGTGTVLQQEGNVAELCLGLVMESYPPQCSGVPLNDWHWTEVEKEESASGVTWGDYELTGRYDGETFTVTEAGPPPPPPRDGPITSACSEPPGGWETPDPKVVTYNDLLTTIDRAEQSSDFSGSWIERLVEPKDKEANLPAVLNLTFTGDIEEHEARARETWAGALCVVEFEHTEDELMQIQRELGEENDFGLEILSSDIDVTENAVEIQVAVIEPATLEEIENKYGDAVRVDPALTPL